MSKYGLVMTESEYQELRKASMCGGMSFKFHSTYEKTCQRVKTDKGFDWENCDGRNVTFEQVNDPYKLAEQLEKIIDFDCVSATEVLDIPPRYMVGG